MCLSYTANADDSPSKPSHWEGVYASTSEIGGFTGTVLSIRVSDLGDGHELIRYTKTFYTDAHLDDEIPQDTLTGMCLVDKNVIYVPKASGYQKGGNISLFASVERFSRVKINGHDVLITDSTLKLYRAKKKLYDYGVLVKVSDKPILFPSEFKKVQHPSVKVLYTDPNKPWRGPFVYGANDTE